MFGFRIVSRLAVAVAAPVLAATVAIVGTPIVALGASALPVVLSFTASKASLPDSGGSFELRASLRYASSCEITVSPGLKGFPKALNCSSDKVAQLVTLPRNKGQNPISYTFGLNVKNAAGITKATNVVVTEGAAPPPISFTTPLGSTITTLVFAPEGVFVADDPLLVTVHNNSSTTQIVTGVGIGSVGDPRDFILNRNNCGYITAHQTCSLAVQFDPSGAGLRTGVVNVLDSSWGSSGTTAPLNLRGIGVWATATLANANIRKNVLSFPSEGVLTASAVQYITLSNAGNVPLYINGIGDTGGEAGDFVVAAGNCQNQVPQIISVGQSCTFAVSFAPSGSGYRTTYVVVDDNTLGTQTQLQVQGTGVYSQTTLSINGSTPEPSPISYNFHSSKVGVNVAATVTIKNIGKVTMDFTGLSATGINPGDFAISPVGTCGAAGGMLATGEKCTIDIAFAPQPGPTGTVSATLKIGDNNIDGGELINVTGVIT